MNVKFKRKILQNGSSLAVVIPYEIIDALKLKKGNMMEVWLEGERIVMERVVECSKLN